jgi:TolB-like protein
LDAVSGRQSVPFDRSVDVLVSRLRRKIEADPESPQLIVTIPGLGYKFTARPQAAGVSADHCELPMIIAAAVADRPGIAVLPFQNISDDPGQECFANGVTEEIITVLARLASFRIIAGPCSKPADVREMGRKLRVEYVLEGSVRWVGHRVRICGRLIDSTSGAHGLTVSRVRHHIEVVMKSPAPCRQIGFHGTLYEGLRMAGLPE